MTVTGLRFDPCTTSEYEALPGNTFAVVSAEFTLTRASGDVGYLGVLTWSLLDSNGESYTSVPSCQDAANEGATLEPGSTVERVISFEIPGTAQGLRFTYFAGDDTAEQTIVVDLGE